MTGVQTCALPIWLELARDLSEDDYKDKKEKDGTKIKGYKSQFKEFEEQLRKVLPFNDSLRSFKKPDPSIFKRRNKQYEILMEKQEFLTRLENEVGKGTSWGEKEDDWD